MLAKIIKTLLIGTVISTVPLYASYASEQTKDNSDKNELTKVKVTMLMEHEGFLTWYAKEKGWDKELGLDIDLSIVHSTGMEIMKMHREDPEGWNITAVSSIPLLIGSKDMPLAVVAIATERAASTGVYIKPDSNIFRVKGWNDSYPNVYGSPETLEGKTFVIQNLSSEGYTLERYLENFQLDFSSVNIIDRKNSNAMEMVENGEADGCVVWAPKSFEAQNRGLQPAAFASQIDTEIPIMIMADKNYADEHDEIVGKFVAVYLKAVDAQLNNAPDLINEYKRFFKTFSGENLTTEYLNYDLKRHDVIPLQAQLPMFEKKGNRKSSIQKLEATIARSLLLILFDNSSTEVINTKKTVKKPRYITDRYLRIAKKYMQ